MNPALNSSIKMDWQTPESFLELVRQVGPIALDPCTVAENPTGAANWFSPEEGYDGLEACWRTAQFDRGTGISRPGIVYVNPPYGRELPRWMSKCTIEAILGAEILALVPARPDTRWFQSAARSATAVLFWSGRIKFRGAKAHAPFPSAVFYWGAREKLFRDAFSERGLWLR